MSATHKEAFFTYHKTTMPSHLEAFRNFPWDDRIAYGNWLAQTYYYVLHSTRILSLAAAHMPLEFVDHHYRFAHHVLEEKGHEALALNDLKALGLNLKDFPEMHETTSFRMVQFNTIERVSPLALFGWVLFLEGCACYEGTAAYQKVVSRFGKKAATFLKVHSSEDVGHIAKALEIVDSIPDQIFPDLKVNFDQSADLYLRMMTKSRDLTLGNQGNALRFTA